MKEKEKEEKKAGKGRERGGEKVGIIPIAIKPPRRKISFARLADL